MHTPDENRDPAREADETPLLEWVVAIVGMLLVAGTIAFLVADAVAGDSSPPDITVHEESIQPVTGGYLVRIRAVNRGGSTASGVAVEGALKSGGEEIEASEMTIGYVPSHSERKGGLFFTKDPHGFALELRAKGYEEP